MVRKISQNFMKKLRRIEKSCGFKTELIWRNILLLAAYHICGFVWCYLYALPAKWQTLVFALVMYMVTGLGVTCGVHRLWSHRSYKAQLPLHIFLLFCYMSAAHDAIYNWVLYHRVHHKYSDTDADPHNVNRGFFFAHVGWLMMKPHKRYIEKSEKIDMSDIDADPYIQFERRYTLRLGFIFGHVLPTLAEILLWGEDWKCAIAWQNIIRPLALAHSEWSVNSFAHTVGYRPYKNIQPTENFVVSFLTCGEGWHNYHHAFPCDYKAAEHFHSLGLSTAMIKLWYKLGLAYDLKEVNPEVVRKIKHVEAVDVDKDNGKVFDFGDMVTEEALETRN